MIQLKDYGYIGEDKTEKTANTKGYNNFADSWDAKMTVEERTKYLADGLASVDEAHKESYKKGVDKAMGHLRNSNWDWS